MCIRDRYREIAAIDFFFAEQLAFVFLVGAFHRGGIAPRAIVAGERFNDPVAAACAGVGQFLFENDAPEGGDFAAVFACGAGGIDFDARCV